MLPEKQEEKRQQVFNSIIKDRFYEDILLKYLSTEEDRNEFRQQLWLIICEMPTPDIIQAWEKKYFKYLYIRIIQNQICSKTSPWHRKTRLHQQMESIIFYDSDDSNEEIEQNNQINYNNNDLLIDDFNPEFLITQQESIEESKNQLKIIDKALEYLLNNNPHFIVESELFKMYYKNNLTYREIAEKTKIPLRTVYATVQTAKMLIKSHIKKHYKN